MNCNGCEWKDSGIKRVCDQCRENFNNHPAIQTAHMERTLGDASLAKEKSKGCNSRCHIYVHSRTNRLSDPDGRSVKALLDGLTKAGILEDDSAKFVSQVSQSQESTKGNEETIITITWEQETP